MKTDNKMVVCHDRNGRRHKVPVSELVYRPSVYGLLIERGRVLLFPQWDGYDFPGGGLEIHETIEQGLKREYWEETGLKIEPVKLLACESSFYKPSSHEESWNCVLIYYLVKKVSGELTDKYFDADEKLFARKAEWITIKYIDKIKFYNNIDSAAVVKEALKLSKKK